jgi:hypothetical protein
MLVFPSYKRLEGLAEVRRTAEPSEAGHCGVWFLVVEEGVKA